MKKLINFLFFIVFCFIIYNCYTNKDKITEYVYKNFIDKQEIIMKEPNKYKRNYDFNFVQNTDNFYPNNYQELINVFYTILNNGWDDFTFYCGEKYDNCLQDINNLTKDNGILSSINNYVHPFNSYKLINVSNNDYGKIDVNVTKLYTDSDIQIIENKIDQVIKEKIKDNMSDYDKIKTIHDYIINNTKYDQKKERVVYSNGLVEYKNQSNKALGAIVNGLAICGGYTDYMELFLEKFNIKSYKISSEKHIWNYVFINNTYKHLDLTFDDPIVYNVSKGTTDNTLSHDYFLIDTSKLHKLDTKDHTYDLKVFN